MTMKQFDYVIKDPVGIHARPAGLLVKEVAALAPTKVFVEKQGRKVEANRLLSLMSLGVKGQDTVTVSVEGGDEEAALAKVQEFFEKNL